MLSKCLQFLSTNQASQRPIVLLTVSSTGSVRRHACTAGAQQTLPVVTCLPQEKRVEVIMPGYTYSDLNRRGLVKIWKIPLFCESVRMAILTRNFGTRPTRILYGKWRDQFRGNGVFVLTNRFELFPAAYNLEHCYNPVRSEHRLLNFGHSAIHESQTAFSIVTGEELYREELVTVFIDEETKRPAKLTEQFKRLYEGVCPAAGVFAKRVEVSDMPGVPDLVNTVSRRSEWSQTDDYLHSNYSQYYMYVYDAAESLFYAGQLKNWTDQPHLPMVKTISAVFKKEVPPNVDLEVSCWVVDSETLGFQILITKTQQVSFQCELKFYK